MRTLLLAALISLFSTTTMAVQFAGSQTGANTWTYDLTYDPEDNYSICQSSTTITITGLSGVTGAAGPTSTDYANSTVGAWNLNWTAQVLDGGTRVVWTQNPVSGSGTGNMSGTQHIYGFTITGSTPSAPAAFATSGFALDGTCPTTVLDISGSVPGPHGASQATEVSGVPGLSPFAVALLAIALIALSLGGMRRS
jgi:hypothetical protein